MPISIQRFVFNPFQENTYLVYNEQGEAFVVDPGCYSREEKQLLVDFMKEKNLSLVAILNTHAHLDHIFGNAHLMRMFSVDLYLHPLDRETMDRAPIACQLYGILDFDPSPEPTKWLQAGTHLSLLGLRWEVLFVPGHAPGHVAFYQAENQILFGGDVVFQGSYGRTDLPGGDAATLKRSILENIFTLPDDTYILSGHGEVTTVGAEKHTNPIHLV